MLDTFQEPNNGGLLLRIVCAITIICANALLMWERAIPAWLGVITFFLVGVWLILEVRHPRSTPQRTSRHKEGWS